MIAVFRPALLFLNAALTVWLGYEVFSLPGDPLLYALLFFLVCKFGLSAARPNSSNSVALTTIELRRRMPCRLYGRHQPAAVFGLATNPLIQVKSRGGPAITPQSHPPPGRAEGEGKIVGQTAWVGKEDADIHALDPTAPLTA
jgi:hypothetical protein